MEAALPSSWTLRSPVVSGELPQIVERAPAGCTQYRGQANRQTEWRERVAFWKGRSGEAFPTQCTKPLRGSGAGGDGRARRLAGQTLLSLDTRHHLHRQVAGIADSFGLTLSRDYEGTSLDSLHQMVASGLGLSVLPGLYLASDVGGSVGLAVLKVANWNAHRSIALAWRRASVMDQAFRLIADHVQRAAGSMWPKPEKC